MNLDGKHVIVTGGGSGVGAETARQISEAGASVTIMGRTKKSLLEQNLPYEVCDVTDRQAVIEAFSAARLARGPITVVVANAGAATSIPFEKLTPEALNHRLSAALC